MSEWTDVPTARKIVKQWITEEEVIYAGPKWESENAELQGQVVQDGTWINFPFSYLRRAEGATLATPLGRQQLGKVITSSISVLSRAVSIYGDMPTPGVSSSDPLTAWVREPLYTKSDLPELLSDFALLQATGTDDQIIECAAKIASIRRM